MPLVQISLMKGKPAQYRSAISENVQRALVETFNVPAAVNITSVAIRIQVFMVPPLCNGMPRLALAMPKPRRDFR